MKVGIVGLPNAGKSSLFNALTRAGAQAANYPFTTVEPNVAIVPVPDDRLDAVVDTIKATPTVYETMEFHDIAGLVRGAHEGEGLGNKFLANIRETDALVHVVRAHDDEQVVHPEGKVDPGTDVETIETELLYADLEQAERRLEKVAREAKGGDKAKVAEEGWLRELVAALGEGRPARTVPVPAAAPDALRNLSPLTSKPVLYLANVGEGEPLEVPEALAAHAERAGARAAAVSARIEAELSELDDEEEAAAMREDLGAGESGLADRGPRGVEAARADHVLHRRRGQGGARLGHRARHPGPPRRGQDPHRHREGLRGRRGGAVGRPGARPAATPRRASRPSSGLRGATTRYRTGT